MTMTESETTTPSVRIQGSPRPDTTSAEDIAQVWSAPGFGQYFTDHMVTATWTRDGGWSGGELRPYGPIALDPSASVFHYGQEIFEGMKAYRHDDGSVWTFRPFENAARFGRSARRLALPSLPEDLFVESIRRLVEVDEAWVAQPGSGESSLYLRPFMIATEAALGVRPTSSALYTLIASPAGPYFSGGLKPVSLWLSSEYVRAAPGGTGTAKCGGNYAASLLAQSEAIEQGCDQVVFLDAVEHRWLEELGGMNIVLVRKDGSLLTPALGGTILEGITRDSVLQLARDLGREVEERKVDVAEWRDGIASGEVTEVFACGTAAVITQIGSLAWEGGRVEHPTVAEEDSVALQLRRALLDLQYGRAQDTRGWMHRLV